MYESGLAFPRFVPACTPYRTEVHVYVPTSESRPMINPERRHLQYVYDRSLWAPPIRHRVMRLRVYHESNFPSHETDLQMPIRPPFLCLLLLTRLCRPVPRLLLWRLIAHPITSDCCGCWLLQISRVTRVLNRRSRSIYTELPCDL